MPTTKYRVNLSVSTELKHALNKLAKRDQTSVATKVLDLIRHALEIEEDAVLMQLAKMREAKGEKYVSHKEAWL